MPSGVPDLCSKMSKNVKATLEPEGSAHAQVTGQEASLCPSPEVIWPAGMQGSSGKAREHLNLQPVSMGKQPRAT